MEVKGNNSFEKLTGLNFIHTYTSVATTVLVSKHRAVIQIFVGKSDTLYYLKLCIKSASKRTRSELHYCEAIEVQNWMIY